MEDDVQVSPEDEERRRDSNPEETPEQDVDPLPNRGPDQVLRDQDRLDAGPEEDGQRQTVVQDSDPSLVDRDQDQTPELDTGSPQDQDQDQDQDQNQDQDQVAAAANQDEAVESGGVVPALVVTQVEECRPAAAGALESPVSPEEPWEPQRPERLERPSDLMIPAAPSCSDLSLSSSSDGGDMACSDLLSLRSDSLSLASEPAVSRRSEEDDNRSVAASSVMSLFQRLQMDPLEKSWLRSCAEGNMAAQRQLLSQEPGLVLKKDFITTALHWAAKQGRQDAVDMMLRSGADVNIRSGYTALHLASIHGHQHIVHSLINTHNAKPALRDYHGKMAVHYWSGCSDVFTKPDAVSGGRFSGGRRTQRYVLPSLRLSRSRSQGQLNLDFGTLSQSSSHDVLDLQL